MYSLRIRAGDLLRQLNARKNYSSRGVAACLRQEGYLHGGRPHVAHLTTSSPTRWINDNEDPPKKMHLFSSAPVSDAEDICHIAFGFMASKALFAALDINLFYKIPADYPISLDQLATRLPDIDKQKLTTLVTALCSVGLIARSSTGLLSNPPAVEAFLSKRKPSHDFGDYLRLQIDKQMYPFMGHLNDNMVGNTGKQAYADYTEWMADEEEARLYTESQHSGSIGPAKTLAKVQGDCLKDFSRMLDVGGGSGGFAITLAQSFPNLSVDVLDFPNVCQIGEEYLAKENTDVRSRVGFRPGDALKSDFPADQCGVLMSYLSSSVGGELLQPLYSKAFNATRSGGAIFVHDFMVDDSRDGPPLTALWALQHMVFTPGARSLTPCFIEAALAGAGYERVSTVEMIPGMTRLTVGFKP
eukprot:m.487639 g.487639  ORF g.487639 m.487639 type:complete len:414 (+) comp21755_c0_seq2:299-1540(+)